MQGEKVMVSRQFKTPIYIAPFTSATGDLPDVTDRPEEAETFDGMDGEAKLEYHQAVTGLRFQYEYVNQN